PPELIAHHLRRVLHPKDRLCPSCSRVWGEVAHFTVRLAVLVTSFSVAEIVTVVDFDTTLVETVKVAVLAPAATRTLTGTVAAAVLLLERVTVAPPVGAGPVSVTVPVEVLPPVTVVGFKLRLLSPSPVVALATLE